MSVFDGVLEKLLQIYTSDVFKKEVAEARRDFFEDAGILNEESHSFELRLSQFLDWYLFTRELSEFHIPPVQLALHGKELVWTEDERALIDALGGCHHSLFEFSKVRGNDIHVKDLFDGKKYVLKESDVNVGFNSDELFEARLLPYQENYIFAKGFCFHPSEVRRFILQEVKKVKQLNRIDREALMLRLMKMRYKHEQYGHIRLDYIYTNESKLKF